MLILTPAKIWELWGQYLFIQDVFWYYWSNSTPWTDYCLQNSHKQMSKLTQEMWIRSYFSRIFANRDPIKMATVWIWIIHNSSIHIETKNIIANRWSTTRFKLMFVPKMANFLLPYSECKMKHAKKTNHSRIVVSLGGAGPRNPTRIRHCHSVCQS